MQNLWAEILAISKTIMSEDQNFTKYLGILKKLYMFFVLFALFFTLCFFPLTGRNGSDFLIGALTSTFIWIISVFTGLKRETFGENGKYNIWASYVFFILYSFTIRQIETKSDFPNREPVVYSQQRCWSTVHEVLGWGKKSQVRV